MGDMRGRRPPRNIPISAPVALASALTSSRPVRLVTTFAEEEDGRDHGGSPGQLPAAPQVRQDERGDSRNADEHAVHDRRGPTVERDPPGPHRHPERGLDAERRDEPRYHPSACEHEKRAPWHAPRPTEPGPDERRRSRNPDTAPPAARWSAGS